MVFYLTEIAHMLPRSEDALTAIRVLTTEWIETAAEAFGLNDDDDGDDHAGTNGPLVLRAC